jgi:hypothetical protein
LSNLVQSCPILSNLVQSCPILSNSVLSQVSLNWGSRLLAAVVLS